ncbi:Calx-beta domain protein [Gimesia maris]|uniref:Calx-beta domain-containing protein n=1 Tax=Gimesia maris TaxID=122 RepID=UPI001187B510|nr:Calx-beta domain-containing protein [Gimesia maris]QDU15104.1 Calx-beta domain protein [Gimesia maris]
MRCPLVNDSVVETDETVLVNLSVGGQAVGLSQSQVAVTIADNDSASISIDDVNINENDGTATFTVTLNQAVQGGLSVDWSTSDGTAVAGSDYTAGSETLNFTGSVGEMQTITISLIDDSDVELTESILVTLGQLVAVGNVTLSTDQAMALIVNDDSLIIDEDASEQTVNLTGIVASDSGLQVQTMVANSDNPALIQNPAVSYVPGNTTGSLTFTPNSDQHGSAIITITITDELSIETTHAFTVVVNPVNDTPMVTTPVVLTTTEEDSIFSLDLLTNASDVDLTDILSISDLTLTGGDDLGITVNGTSLDINPSAYNGLAFGESEVITYSFDVIDGNGGLVAQTATISISGMNDAPMITAPAVLTATEEDSISSLALLTNASDVDLTDILSISDLTLTGGDDLGITVNGTLLDINPSAYTGLAFGESEVITYSFDVIDGNGGLVAQTATISISGMNDAPMITAPAVLTATEEDSISSLALLTNASDVDLTDILSISDLTLTGGDDLGITVNGTLLDINPSAYTGLAFGESEVITYSYNVIDGNGGVTAQSATITITGENDAPVANNGTLSATEDGTTVTTGILVSDVDSDNDASSLTYAITVDPSEGTAESNDDGTFTFNPGTAFQDLAAGETRVVTFTYTATDAHSVVGTGTITVTVTGVNDAPTVNAPVVSTVTEDDSSFSLDLLAGASDVDQADTLSISDLTLTGGDALGVTVNGTSLDIDPSAYTGLAVGESEVITYSFDVIDGNGGVVAQTATITITGVNDAPTVAASVNSTVTEDDGSFSLDLLTNANDVDLTDTLHISDLTLTGGDALGITVNGTSLDIDPSAYTGLAAGESEVITYSYNVIDGNGGEIAQTATITITGVNDVPTLDAISDPTAIDEDAGEQTINLTGITAGGGESQTLTVTAVSDNPALMADPVVTYTSGDTTGSLTYTPLANQNGTATITVTVTDGQLGEVTHTFTVVVNPVNDVPTLDAISDPTAIDEDASEQTINLTGITAGGGESQTLTVTASSDNPALIADPVVTYTSGDTTGSLAYTPLANQNGTATITVTVTDEQLGEVTRSFTVIVNPVNDAPVAEDDSITAYEDTVAVTSLFANHGAGVDSDVDAGDTILVVAVNDNTGDVGNEITLASGALVKVNSDGSFYYNPNGQYESLALGETATDSFTYTIDDGHGATDTATVTVTIHGVNDDPIANDVTGITTTDTVAVDGSFSGSDVDDDPGLLSYSLTSQPTDGTVSDNGDGTFTFDPGSDFDDLQAGETRTVTFTYKAIDPHGGESEDGTVTVTVTGSAAILAISDATIDESAGTATFYVTVSRRVGQIFSIDYEAADSSSTVADGDYIANTGTLVFYGDSTDPLGAETQTITVLINNDQLSEGQENFHVNLSGLSLNSPTLILNDTQGEATIIDDDTAAFSIDDISVNEADGTAVFTVTLNQDVDSAVSVDWSTADDSAVQALDYQSNSGTLNFSGNAGETKTITIILTQDTEIESLEQFVVSLSNAQSSGQSITIADAQGIATITDDDSASLAINDITVNEGAGTATFTVTLTGQVGETVTVDWSTADNTADEISDYLAASGTLTFAGNNNETQTITVNLLADEVQEAAESFYVNLTDAFTANKSVSITDSQGEATISANAEEFSINDIAIHEGSGSGTKTMTFTVTRSGADLTQLATIDFRTLTDPATLGGNDFVAISTPVTLTFAAADPGVTFQTQTVSVTINKDDSVEMDEEFTVQIENASSGTIARDQAIGTIVNDDHASLIVTGYEISPGLTSLVYREDAYYAYVVVTLDKAVSGGLSVDWSTEDIDALAGIDYTPDAGTLTFAGNAGETQTITIDLLNDNYVEPQNTFAVKFSNLIVNTSGFEKNVSLSKDVAVVEIFNEDHTDLLGTNIPNIVVTPTSGHEGISNTVKFNVLLDADMEGVPGATFYYTTVDGTATVADNDYIPTSGYLTFQGNENEYYEIWVTINDDSIAELTETFYLTLTQTSGVSLPIDLSTASATIYDHDTTPASVSIDDITVSEDDEVATVTVSLSEASIVDLSMLVNTGDPADTAGSTDYFGLEDYQIVIPAGETSFTFELPLYRDLLVEEDETFTITLSDLKANGGPAAGWASFSDATAVVTIADIETTGLSVSDAEVDENVGTATFTVSLGTVASDDITFDVSTIAGTATGGVDYTELTNQPYTITAGESSIDITVSIINDSLFEGSEAFSLALSNILVGGIADDRLTVLNSTGTGTINDDEAASITIADLTVNEGATNAVLTVTVDQAVGYAFTVDWATQGVTAFGQSDYTTSSGTLNFTGLTAGETQQITIPITDDNIVEWDELFHVNLSNLSAGGANVTLADDQAEVTITGNNDIAQLSISDLTALEHNQFGFEITLDKAATRDITVLVNTTDGTADSSDYTALTDYKVTIAAGETSAFVYVDVIDDSLIESAETFTVTLSGELIDGATDATRVGIADGTATGTISNNDFTDPTTTANAVDDYYFVKIEDLGTTFELNVLNNDTRTGTTNITSITAATGGGTAAVGQTAGDDVIIFTPSAYASGTITFNYIFEDSALNTGTGKVTIVIVDAYGIYGNFVNDRFEPGIDTPGLGKVPEYISQDGFADGYLERFESLSLIDDTETIDTTDTVIYQNALGTGGSFSITTEIDSTLTRDYTDLGGGSWEYSETLESSYTITTSFSDAIGISEFNTINLTQWGDHDYQYSITYTATGTGTATTTWDLSENASDHYQIDADFTIEEEVDEFTTVVTTTILDSTYNRGDQTLTLSASATIEEDGQGGEILLAEDHDVTLFQYDEYKEEIVSTSTVGQDSIQIGTSVVMVNTDGINQWTRTSDRDYVFDSSNEEYSNTEGFSYSSLGHDRYSSLESTNIVGTINQTEDITVTEETTDENGVVTPAVVLSTTITTVNDIDIDSTDLTYDEFSFTLEGNKEFNNIGSSSIDTELTTYSYTDSGYSDYSIDGYSEVDVKTENDYGTSRIYTLNDSLENSHSEYTTETSNTSRFGNTSGMAHSEYTYSGWSNYDSYSETIFESSDTSDPNITSVYTSTEIADTDGNDSYRDIEVLDEQLVASTLEGTSSYLSSSHGVDHHDLSSTIFTSTVNTQFPGSSLTVTSLIESTDHGITNWKSSYSNKGNYQIYDAINPISAAGVIYEGTNLESYADSSSGDRTTTYHTRDTSDYTEGPTLSISSTADYDESHRYYEFLDAASGTSTYSTVEESLDSTGDQRTSTFTLDQQDQYSYQEMNGSVIYVIDQFSSQFADTDIDGLSTEILGLHTYNEPGTKTWSVNDGGISNYNSTDISTTVDAGENWTADEENSSSEVTSHDWTEYQESGNSTFITHSEMNRTTIDETVPGIKNTVNITTVYDETSGTVTPEEGADPISNNSYTTSLRTDDFLYADGSTSSWVDSESKESSASLYSQTESSSFELIDTSDPAVTSVQSGMHSNELTNGERTSQTVSAEQTMTTGTPLPEGTPDSDYSDPLSAVYDLDEMHYVITGQITNDELLTDRSEFSTSETTSTVEIIVQYAGQSTPDSGSLITQLIARAGQAGTAAGIAPAPITGGFGGSGGSFTFGGGLNVPPGSVSQMGGSFYRVSTSDSVSADEGTKSLKSQKKLTIDYLGETGVETSSLTEVTEVLNLTDHSLAYETFDTSKVTSVPDASSSSSALPLSSFQSARSVYFEEISQDPEEKHITNTFVSYSSYQDAAGDVTVETVNRITASTNLTWELTEYSESGGGNNGTNAKLYSHGNSRYDGVHEEVITSVTDPNQEDGYLTTSVVTEIFATHAEDYQHNDIRYGGSNQLSAISWLEH